ncbi:MAG: hypothetical protein WDZ40_01070 [Candidatus Spechtbacterales bacterium]
MKRRIESVELGGPPYGVMSGAKPTQHKWFLGLSPDFFKQVLVQDSGDMIHDAEYQHTIRKEKR